MYKYARRFAALALGPLLLLSCAHDSTPVPPRMLTEATKAQLETAADSVFSDLKPPGMIALISVEGGADYLIKRGVSNTVTGRPMSEDYYFRIGSNTKTVLGTAVLILVDEGKIQLDIPIATYLPEYHIPNGDRITVRMLGNMTSGLFNYTDDPAFFTPFLGSGYSYAYTTTEILAASLNRPPNFEPGARYEYCNTNIVLLGLLLEKVTGKSAKQVIEEKVIQPMGLTHTYWPDSGALTEPYTHGYSSSLAVNTVDATNCNPSWTNTAGILISTFADMKIWAKAVAEGTLLSEQTQAERFRWVDDHYGFCVMKAGTNWFGHAGTIFGYNSHVFYNTEKKMTYIVLVNQDSGTPVETFSRAFMGILDK